VDDAAKPSLYRGILNPIVGLVAGVGIAYCACWMRYYERGVKPAQFLYILALGAVCGVFMGIRSAGGPREGRTLRTAAVLAALVIVGVLINVLCFSKGN